MKPQHLALTAAAALVAGALVKWLLADDDEKDDEAAHRKQAALRARAREIKAQKAMARRPKRARPTAAKRLQQNNALAVAYGGSQEAVDVAARARCGPPRPRPASGWMRRCKVYDGIGQRRAGDRGGPRVVGAHGRAPAAEPGEAIGGHGREVSTGAQADDRDAVVVYKRGKGAPRGDRVRQVARDSRRARHVETAPGTHGARRLPHAGRRRGPRGARKWRDVRRGRAGR